MRLLHSTVLALLGLRTIQALPLAQDSTVEQVGSQTVQDPSSSPAWPDQVGGWLYQNRNNFLTAAGVLGGTKTLQWALSRTLDGHVGKKAARIMRKTPEQEREKVRALTPQERVEYREQVARMLHKHNGIDLDEARCIVKYAYPETGEYLRLETAKTFFLLSNHCRQEVAEARRRSMGSEQQTYAQANPEDRRRTKQTPNQAMGEDGSPLQSRLSVPSFHPGGLRKSMTAYRPNVDTGTLLRGLSAYGSNVGRSPVPKMAMMPI